MARTADGQALTGRHHQAQGALRARALRDYLLLWPLWRADDPASFDQLVAAAVPLVTAYAGLSASLAAGYYDAFRRAEHVDGSATPRPSGPPDTDKIVAGLVSTGRIQVANAILSGKSPQAARQSALVTTSGTVTRLVLNGGRDTIVRSTMDDRRALGYARVTAGKPCAFCAMLASRGPVYKQGTVDFQAHDHCACSGEPAYDGSEWPGRAREFRRLYNEAVREARAAGELQRDTSNDSLNAFRRKLERV